MGSFSGLPGCHQTREVDAAPLTGMSRQLRLGALIASSHQVPACCFDASVPFEHDTAPVLSKALHACGGGFRDVLHYSCEASDASPAGYGA